MPASQLPVKPTRPTNRAPPTFLNSPPHADRRETRLPRLAPTERKHPRPDPTIKTPQKSTPIQKDDLISKFTEDDHIKLNLLDKGERPKRTSKETEKSGQPLPLLSSSPGGTQRLSPSHTVLPDPVDEYDFPEPRIQKQQRSEQSEKYTDPVIDDIFTTQPLTLTSGSDGHVDDKKGKDCLLTLKTIRQKQEQDPGRFPYARISPYLLDLLKLSLPTSPNPQGLSAMDVSTIVLRTASILLESHPSPESLTPILHILFIHSRNSNNDVLFSSEKLLLPLLILVAHPTWKVPFAVSEETLHNETQNEVEKNKLEKFKGLLYLLSLLRNITSSPQNSQSDTSISSFLLNSGILNSLSQLSENVILPVLTKWTEMGGREPRNSRNVLLKLLGSNLELFFTFTLHFTSLIRNLCNSPAFNAHVINSGLHLTPTPAPDGEDELFDVEPAPSPKQDDSPSPHLLSLFLYILPSLLLFPDPQVSFNISRIYSRISLLPCALPLLSWEEENEDDEDEDRSSLVVIDITQPVSSLEDIISQPHRRNPQRLLQQSYITLIQLASRNSVDLSPSVSAKFSESYKFDTSPLPISTLIRLLFAAANLVSSSVPESPLAHSFRTSWSQVETCPAVAALLGSLYEKWSRTIPADHEQIRNVGLDSTSTRSSSIGRQNEGQDQSRYGLLCDCLAKLQAFIANLCIDEDIRNMFGSEDEMMRVCDLVVDLNKRNSEKNDQQFKLSGLVRCEEETLLNSIGLLGNLTSSQTFLSNLQPDLLGDLSLALLSLFSYGSNSEIVSESARAMSNLATLKPVREKMLKQESLEFYMVLLICDDINTLLPIVGGLLNLAEDKKLAEEAMLWSRPDDDENIEDGCVHRLLQLLVDFGLMNLTFTTVVCRCIVNICSNAKTKLHHAHSVEAKEILDSLRSVAAQYVSDPPQLMDSLLEAIDRARSIVE
ncbi:hypothetical protein BLNAU_8907 [Blattamonas nauphoetae]|uniref:Wings apart-like protein C-terminal domain-containing protein n=1 Tax=Blattamonas nauphoetae TaxID=2049346 RepID=A0ABQ9XXB1_9EUKA|nr:hypothetical protein BLNAU_8907 [Blattamonas nauphoetae]